MVIYHIDMVILDIDMGYGLMIWEMTSSMWSSWRSIWDILSLCLEKELLRVAPHLNHRLVPHVVLNLFPIAVVPADGGRRGGRGPERKTARISGCR